jgi:hypothetical protein
LLLLSLLLLLLLLFLLLPLLLLPAHSRRLPRPQCSTANRHSRCSDAVPETVNRRAHSAASLSGAEGCGVGLREGCGEGDGV